jgi:hypothetical protein
MSGELKVLMGLWWRSMNEAVKYKNWINILICLSSPLFQDHHSFPRRGNTILNSKHESFPVLTHVYTDDDSRRARRLARVRRHSTLASLQFEHCNCLSQRT